MKKIDLLIVFCAMALGTNALAAEIIASGTPDNGNGCGSNCSWSLDDSGVLTLSGTGTTLDGGNGEAQPWLDYRSDILKVVVESGITSVGRGLFRNISTLEEVTFPKTLGTIGSNAFTGTSVTSVTIPSSVTSLGYQAFGHATHLSSVTFEEPSGLTSLGNAFIGSGLTSIKIPEGVTSLGGEEFNATYNHIKSISIPDSMVNNIPYYAVYMVTQVNDFTANADNLRRFLEAGGGFMAGADGKINVTCTSGDCEAYLKNESKYKDSDLLNAIQFKPYLSKTPNNDGSYSKVLNGKIVGYKGKRIYTIDEANLVAGPVNRVSIKYR